MSVFSGPKKGVKNGPKMGHFCGFCGFLQGAKVDKTSKKRSFFRFREKSVKKCQNW